ncbi:MAG: hemerythrin family protein [Rhodospirillaceae bacterium]|nr:hemerythrin family protein [Rhodospirillales bacterium]
MSVIAWTGELSVGVERLDEHHRRLINLLNQLGMAVAADDAQHVTGLVLGELIRYVFYHFGEEERLMEAAGYEDLAAHRQSHRIMADHVRTLERNYDTDPSRVVAAELYAFLADWLVHHIRSEDLRYIPSLAALQSIA